MRTRFLVPQLVLCVTIALVFVLRWMSSSPTPAVSSSPAGAAWGAVPEFSLLNADGRKIGRSQLAGKVWVVNFIFTRCRMTCPQQTLRMHQLQEELASQPAWRNVRLVSVSVDPTHDTPAVLQAYSRQAGADPAHWYFLTGPREAIWQLSKDGFQLGAGEAPPGSLSPLFHSSKFVVVDQQGRIRGYFEGTAPEVIGQTRALVQQLLKERPS